jgi:tRNA uridine 5-carbamoylmethylation protein Kti12
MGIMKKIYILVGIPGSGKSTWIKNQPWLKDAIVISSDNHIEAYATSIGKTYNDVYRDYIKTAEKLVKRDIKNAITSDKDVIIDQTNVTAKGRKKKLNLFKNHYKIAVVFKILGDDELYSRLKSRPGKHISKRTIDKMKCMYEPPSLDEGFDEIWKS